MRFLLRNWSTSAQKVPNLNGLIMQLRSETGMSLSLCREAAAKSGHDYALAMELLGKIGSESMRKKLADSSAIGKEGLIGVLGDSKRLNVVELRCDSDFVAMNTEMIEFANALLNEETPLSLDGSINGRSIQEAIDVYRAKFRENISLSTALTFKAGEKEALGYYLHQKIGANCGKAVGIVSVNSASSELANQIAPLLARQLVACQDSGKDIDAFLKSQYLFDDSGSVKDYINKFEDEYQCQLTLSSIFSRRIKS